MKKLTKIFIYGFLAVFVVFGIIFAFNIGKVFSYATDIKFQKDKLVCANTKINLFDSNNNEINTSSVLGNKVVSLNELPGYVSNAFISIEDKTFYKHNGLNYKRMIKALITNVTHLKFVEGASTISQQLIKNTHLSNDKTIERKVKEIILTKKLEEQFSKKDILETYLNVIYFGNSAYGIESASQTYFNKPASELSINEACGLAGLIKSPKTYSPIYNYDNFITRKNLVLKNMLNDGYITNSDYETNLNESISITNNSNRFKNKSIYENAAIDEACAILNITDKELAVMGLKVYTNYNKEKQENIVNSVCNEIYYPANRNGIVSDGCSVIINSRTGGIEAFYGKGNFAFHSFKRQPGSAIKPILVYAPAFEFNLINPKTKILNEKLIGDYSPNNVGGTEKKYVSVEESVASSLNIPAVKVLEYVGINRAKNFASNIGIEFDKNDNNYALALGGFTYGINIIDLACSYTALANNGYYSLPHFINKIETSNGRIIYEFKNNTKKVMREDTAYLLTDVLQKATVNGTSKRLATLPFKVASKTGTVGVSGTNFNTDAYSIAYTPNEIVCSWLGNGDGKSESTLDGSNNGGTYATSMVKEIYENLYANRIPQNFIMPTSVVERPIDGYKYEKDNVVEILSENFSQRFAIPSIFSIYNLPPTSKDDFIISNLTTNSTDNVFDISFDGLPYYEYELFRCSDTEITKLKVLNNNEHYLFTDGLPPYNCEFWYEIRVLLNGNDIDSIKTEKFYLTEQKKWFY